MAPSIRDARTARDAAAASYEAQVIAAHHAGRSMAEIAREAGVSRQRVWKIIQDAPPRTEEEWNTTSKRAGDPSASTASASPSPNSARPLVKLERRTP